LFGSCPAWANLGGSKQCRAHRNHAPTALGLWCPKSPVRVHFRNLDIAAQKIKAVPPEREDLSDPHSSKHRCHESG